MQLSKNNIIVKIQNTDIPEYAILNPISGSFDLMNEKEYYSYLNINETPLDKEMTEYLLERGYLYENADAEKIAVNKAYKDFNQEIADSQVQLMLVPTYSCNLACTYCFQHGIDGRPTLITREIVDTFFEYAKETFSQTSIKPFITLFGGEPLINSPAQRAIVNYIVDRCVDEGYEFSAVTNGFDFVDYVDILKKVTVKEIQFTLDGSRAVHDTRRATENKKGTFDRIISGIEAAVNNKMPVNLRSVVDLENIEDIVNLATYLDSKGWLDLPQELFKTQIGRNYELFDCYAKPQHLMSQVELWAKYSTLSKQYPILLKFHRPDFKGMRHLVDTGKMYMASFDTCPACKTEWVFDLYGHIYGCTASCGREEYLLGTFWPEVNLNEKPIDSWKKRDVKSIEKCRDCSYDVICGGGCGVVSANQHKGEILSPDCRPIQELLDIGVNHYIDQIKAMSENNSNEGLDETSQKVMKEYSTNELVYFPDDKSIKTKNSCCSKSNDIEFFNLNSSCTSKEKASCCTSSVTNSLPIKNENSQSIDSRKIVLKKPEQNTSFKKEIKPMDTKVSSNTNNTSGCLVCGSELIYSNESPMTETCLICGKVFETYAKCVNGHYICDTCHSLDILGKVEQLLLSSTQKNPITLAKQIFELPGLNMHGPEYHSIIPAVLVTAYQNTSNHKDISKIKESIKRGKEVKGGNCGFLGNCGAGTGSGIAVSIIESATPMSDEKRGAANIVTGHALIEIGKHGGPRCCKREAITSIETFIRTTKYFENLNDDAYVCTQFAKNKDCIYQRCPYFPKKLT